jgi:hypothetical protein
VTRGLPPLLRIEDVEWQREDSVAPALGEINNRVGAARRGHDSLSACQRLLGNRSPKAAGGARYEPDPSAVALVAHVRLGLVSQRVDVALLEHALGNEDRVQRAWEPCIGDAVKDCLDYLAGSQADVQR